MTVFTSISIDDTNALLNQFNLGHFISLKETDTGTDNTNYFLSSTKGEYILTIFEFLNFAQLNFHVKLMQHLYARNIPVPSPQVSKNGKYIFTLKGKPCVIVSRLPGQHETIPSSVHCALVGENLAHLHLAALDFPIYQENRRSLSWFKKTAPKVLPFLRSSQVQLLNQNLKKQYDLAENSVWKRLPTGPVHCDLFRDNLLFSGTFRNPLLSGIIDFYFSCYDTWLLDVAISVNDWCIDQESAEFVPDLLHALLSAYIKIRPFTQAEKQCWASILQVAALRFWLSRLLAYHVPRYTKHAQIKNFDPQTFERILQSHCQLDKLPSLP